MNRVLALILAGGAGERLSGLVAERAKPAVPFGGKYRLIDFSLSNCSNSGIRNVAVLTQFNPRSLAQHIGVGRPWNLDREPGGVEILQPYIGSCADHDWYKGTADAVFQNLYYVVDQKVDEVIILAGDHIYTMRYDYMIDAHRSRGADITLGVVEVELAEASRFGIISLDRNDRVTAFDEKPKEPKSNLASMGIYIFNKDCLLALLDQDSKLESGHDFGKNIIPSAMGRFKVFGYRFRDYWRDVGTVRSYWQANMDLVVDLPDLNLYGPDMQVRTVPQQQPPVKIGPRASVVRSLVCNGCIINGRVENSVLSAGVYVEEGALVKESIIFDETTIERGSVVNHSIVDKQAWIGENAVVGYGDDLTPNKEESAILHAGITLVGKGAKVPPGIKIGRNCKIESWVDVEDFLSTQAVNSGDNVKKKVPRRYRI
jgi:glucose-1-phosphate adenylyltransferase